ncbi:MAG: VOC family protein [Chromatiales bacterium]|jgi:glyoxylase I family protein|nr:VOC family protein [Chromatiales bacterium]
MKEIDHYATRRQALADKYLAPPGSAPASVAADNPSLLTAGVDHLALICSDVEATIEFYTQVLQMRLTRIVQNRDDATSTHIFLDMGGGNLLAFFDFPQHGPAKTVRGVGSMHHVALKASQTQYGAVLQALESGGIEHSIHGDKERGSVYMRDPDNIMVEVTTGY